MRQTGNNQVGGCSECRRDGARRRCEVRGMLVAGGPYVVLARSGITRMDGLKGKTIAASASGTPPDIVARASLAAFKVSDQDIKFAAIGGVPDAETAFRPLVLTAARQDAAAVRRRAALSR